MVQALCSGGSAVHICSSDSDHYLMLLRAFSCSPSCKGGWIHTVFTAVAITAVSCIACTQLVV